MSDIIHRRSPVLNTIIWGLVLIWIIAAGFPFLWTLWGSFKVQGDFFSKADWANAIYGVRTHIETGSMFTGKGYYGAWIAKEFWFAALNTGMVVVSVVFI
jgi:trehalose/maltose transport system permease protein